jgi:hypothetical protein
VDTSVDRRSANVCFVLGRDLMKADLTLMLMRQDGDNAD